MIGLIGELIRCITILESKPIISIGIKAEFTELRLKFLSEILDLIVDGSWPISIRSAAF